MTQHDSGGQSRTHRGSLAALLALSLLWASGPLRSELLPERFSGLLPPFAAQALPLAMLAIASGSLAFWRRALWPRGQVFRSAVLIGLGLFAAPAVAIHLAAPLVPAPARTALLTLVPVFTVACEPYLSTPAARPIRGGLLAALLAVLGSLLVFQTGLPTSLPGCGAFALVILAAAGLAWANCHSASVLQAPAHPPLAPIAAIAASAAALSLGSLSLLIERSEWRSSALLPGVVWAASIELPALALLFQLLGRLSAVRLATRFLLGPLFVVPLGALLLQMPLAPRTWLGLLAIACGSGYLLFAPETASEPTTLLRLPRNR